MESLGDKQQNSSNSETVESVPRGDSREGSVDRKVASVDRDEKLRVARERQNEDRQRKIEELKAQAEAAQKYREQKEEERRRRIEELRNRDTEKRNQVEERKRAIMEAEKERREYILRKNQERETRLESKKRERNSISFAFGSSTPRLLEPADFGMVSSSTFWGQRRSTSISNVAGASLSRRSSERELADSGTKKRATSASGTDRHDDHRRKSSSMYEVFNWNDEPPKRFSLSIVGSEINIDDPPAPLRTNVHTNNYNNNNNSNSNYYNNTHRHNITGKEDNVDTSQIVFRSVARRKTDLMPTIPSPRDGHHHYGSKSSLNTTPRTTPGRAYSMTRLDQLAQPIRRNGEHLRAILERERRERMELLDETESVGGGRRTYRKNHGSGGASGNASADPMSRSMTHLAGGRQGKYHLGGGISSSFRPLSTGNRDACKSMTLLSNSTTWSHLNQNQNQNHHQQHYMTRSNLGLQTAATKKYLQSSLATNTSSNASKRQGQQLTNQSYRFDPNSLLLMNSSSVLVTAGSRSGNVTPGGSMNTSRPGSAMSTSTTLSTSGYVARRAVPTSRKQRPASIAGTGLSLGEINKLKKDPKLPMKTSTPAASAQTTPKRTPTTSMMSTSMIVTSSNTRMSSAEKKTPIKREVNTPRSTSTPKSLTKTASFDRLNKVSKDKAKDMPAAGATTATATAAMTKSAIIPSSTKVAPAVPQQNQQNDVQSENEQKQEEIIPIANAEANISVNNHATDAPTVAAEPSAPIKPELVAINTENNNEMQQQSIASIEQAENIAPAPIAADVSEKMPENVANNTEVAIEQPHQPQEQLQEPQPQQQLQEAQPQQSQQQPTQQPQQQQLQQFNNEIVEQKNSRNNSKENSEVRELAPAALNVDGNADMMTASMIARKITTEEQAKAALAERRRLAREEAERQAELERQRIEAERQAELKRQQEEAEQQRLFEEEATRLAEEQRRGEEERLRQAIEEAKQREEEERLKREEEERQRVEREEAERKAKEEAEKQRIEVAERLKREEKEREERRKRVEAIMSRTRKGGAAGGNTTPNSTPVKENNGPTKMEKSGDSQATNPSTEPQNETANPQQQQQQQPQSGSDSNSSISESNIITTTTTTTIAQPIAVNAADGTPLNTQATYEQAVIDKENALINSFSNMIIDENAKNLQQQFQQQPQQILEVFNGKLHTDNTTTTTAIPTSAIANGNGHLESINKNDITTTTTVTTNADQLIDLSIESQDNINNSINFNNNNNNSLLTITTTTTTNTPLVTADSHEHKDISLL